MRIRAVVLFLTSMFLIGLLGVSETRGQAYCTIDSDCIDGNVCTVDRCIANGCSNVSMVGIPCQPENRCYSGICSAVCIPQAPLDCNDHNPCTVDGCDYSIGCTHQGTTCDDGNPCTTDTCTLPDICAHQPADCADANPCTLDQCDPSIGCTHQGTDCDDGDPCTIDGCLAPGECVHRADACDDGISCTRDFCDPSTGACSHDPHGGPCAENPKSVGYWQGVCRGNGNHQDTITDSDVSFIRASSHCELPIRIHATDDVCRALSENGDEHCVRAEQEFIALALNLSHLRVSSSDGIDSRCREYNRSVRDSFTEAASYICFPPGCLFEPCDGLRPDACDIAECECKEINQGRALHVHALVVSRLANGTVRLTWIPPVADPDSLVTTPHRYRIWRGADASDLFVQIGEVSDPTFDDTTAVGERLVYDVTPVW